jgi:hypothetical protein
MQVMQQKYLYTCVGNTHIAVFPRAAGPAPTPCAQAKCGKQPSGTPLAGSSQLQGISTARGIPLKLHQSGNSNNTKREFELVTRLGQSSISNYTACRVFGLLCVQCGIPAGQNGV